MVAIAPPPVSTAQPTYDITDDDKTRQKEIAAAWKAYEGKLDPPLKKMEGEPDDNVLSNRMAEIVDRGVDFLFGKELEISVEEGGPEDAQTVIDKNWGRKETRIPLLQKLAMNGALARNGFLRIRPSTSLITRATTYRLVAVDPSIVFVQTAPQDCDTVLLYCTQFSTMQTINGQKKEVYYREEISRIDPDGNAAQGLPDDDDTWSIMHWTAIGQKNSPPKLNSWTPAGPPIAWNYPFAPLFSCQNLPKPNDFWGYPDITPDLIGLNNALNLVQSNINRIEKIYGGPILYAPGTGNAYIMIEPGMIIQLPLSDQKIDSVAIHTDVANALVFAGTIRSDIDELSGIPGVATGRIEVMPRGNLSGIAIELLFMPALKKTDKKRCGYGELIIDVSKALLVLNGMSGDIELELSWSDPLPHDDLPSIQAGIAKLEIGISKTTVQREQGYDPVEEAALSQAENLQKIADAQNAMAAGLMPSGLPGTPLLPNQPPPAPPGTPPTAIGQSKPSPFLARSGGP